MVAVAATAEVCVSLPGAEDPTPLIVEVFAILGSLDTAPPLPEVRPAGTTGRSPAGLGVAWEVTVLADGRGAVEGATCALCAWTVVAASSAMESAAARRDR
jgi:hypothetical protein